MYTKTGTSSSLSYTETITSAGNYYYAIRAVSAGGFESAPSTPTTVTAGPAVPTNVTASAAYAQVTVSWTTVTGASSYNVYRSDIQTGTYTKIGAPTTASYTEAVASVGTYYYKASAVGASGFESAPSSSTTVTVTALTMEIAVTSLSETLSWLAANAVNSSHYTLLLTRNETIPPQTLSYSGMDVTVTLKEKNGERSMNLSGYGSIFTVRSGATLVLDSGLTIWGHLNNDAALVRVNSGGNLVLKDGAKIGNNRAVYGGGVYVYGGMFTMSGGEISGNSASASYYTGGGVFVDSISRFTKQSGGVIYGSNASSALTNTATNGNARGHAIYVYINSSTTRKRDTTVGVGITLDSGSAGGWE